MWNVTENKRPTAQQDIKVAIIVKEMTKYTYATYAAEFEGSFLSRIKDIPRTNNYEASYFFVVKTISLKCVEIWKKTINGDLKHKMFTLEYEQVNHSNIPCC